MILIRTIQLYSVFFIFYYEHWPSQTRDSLTGFFMFWNVSAHLWTQDMYYEFIQNFETIAYVTFIFFLALLVYIAFCMFFFCNKRLKFRLDHNFSKVCNIYRWGFWLTEILYIPFLINIAYAGTCTFQSARSAIEIAVCTEQGPIIQWIMFGLVIATYTIAVIYNLLLFSILYTNKISSTFHEQAIEKKEVEYSLGINKIWNLSMFYTFSSFTSTKSKMYHRIYFNLYILVIVLF
mmetsp:Transcript_97756/g.134482  ORF Transcript_97756/g.134482 Transcript_97756/m.134482 type:complete len:235 (-) Transcript_97756:819-1523(-)